MERAKTYKTYVFIVFASLFSKVLGLFRDMLLANFYGTGPEAAAFTTAANIPLLFFDITLGTAVSSAFIPVLNEFLGKEGKERAFSYTNVFLSFVLTAATALSVLGVLLSRGIVFLSAPGLDAGTALLTSVLLKIIFPVVVLASAAFTLVGVLQSFGSFKVPAVMSAVSNLAVILYFLFLNDAFGITGLAAALTFGWALQLAILLPPL
jgi:putative peptidoglycan lipid II flippase